MSSTRIIGSLRLKVGWTLKIATRLMISRASWSTFSAMDSDDVVATVNRYLPPVVTLILSVLVAWQAAGLVWMMVPGTEAGDPVATPASMPSSSNVAGSQTNVAAIAAAHLFGEADAEDAAPVELLPEDDLADTRQVNLVLRGTVASRQEEFSVAVISNSGSEDKVYGIGDQISSGTTLHAVYADRVVLNEGGVLTNLRLPREFAEVQVSNPVRRQTQTTRQANNNLQAAVASNISNLSEVVRFSPWMQNGKPAGFRVYPGRDRQAFQKLGLRPGDIVKEIDGQTLNDQAAALQIFQSLGQAQQVTVTVERDGQPQSMVLSVDQLQINDAQDQ